MKLTIIHPVTYSACELDKVENDFVREHLMKDTETEFVYINQGFPTIENETHVTFNAPSVVLAAKAAYERGSDGVFINCFCDPGVQSCRELLPIPVLGACQPTLHIAHMMAERFAVITTTTADIVNIERICRFNDIHPSVIRAINMDVLALHSDTEEVLRRLTAVCMELWTEERCGAVALGCTCMCAVASKLQENIYQAGSSLTVLEPYVTGVVQLETLVRLGVSTHMPGISPELDSLIWY